MQKSLKPAARILLGLVCALAANIGFNQEVGARNLFVSPSGSGVDGSSWSDAWQDPSKIDWSKVASGDQIYLDGGSAGLTYKTSFSVPVSNIAIRQSAEAGHTGQVVLSGAGTANFQNPPVGMTVVGSSVRVIGARRSGIKFHSYASEAVRIQTNYNQLHNVEINIITGRPPYSSGKVGGLTFGGYGNQFVNCDFRDTFYGAVENPVSGVPNINGFSNCTFGSNSYGAWAQNGTGLVGSKTASSKSGASSIYVNRCVFGPYLDYGIEASNSNVIVQNSLFLGAKTANINIAPATEGAASMQLASCTLYQNKLIVGTPFPYPIPQNTISSNGLGRLSVKASVIYGGYVNVPPSQVINGGGNKQFAVSGNTVALAPTMEDPNFVDGVAIATPSAPSSFIPRTLTTLNFSLVPSGGIVAGLGSPIVRVSDICAPFGPTTGLPTNIGGP